MLYKVSVPEIWYQDYEVEAGSPEKAKEKISQSFDNGILTGNFEFSDILELEKFPDKWIVKEIK